MVFVMLGGCCCVLLVVVVCCWLLLCVGKVDPHVKLCVVVYWFIFDPRFSFGSILNLFVLY